MKPRSSMGLALALATLAIPACDTTPVPAACTDIPDGGCPEDNGATVCEDQTCGSVYSCEDGKWVLVQQCPSRPHNAGPVDAGSADAPASVFDVHIDYDLPPGANAYGDTPACTDLELPDCSLATAAACGATPDCCGCEDVWICESSGWAIWGSCGDAGPTPNMK